MTNTRTLPRSDAWQAQSLPQIEQKRKQVVRDARFAVAIELTPAQEADYARAVGLIRTGGDLSDYYRRSTVHDRLLRDLQILHLHLGGAGSNAILYVVQYPSHVLLVRVDSHIHLDDLPPGKRLNLLGRREFERQLAADAHDRRTALADARARLLQRSSKDGQGEEKPG